MCNLRCAEPLPRDAQVDPRGHISIENTPDADDDKKDANKPLHTEIRPGFEQKLGGKKSEFQKIYEQVGIPGKSH